MEFQGAYGIAENIAKQAYGGLFMPSDLNNGNGGSGKFLEVGGGYFKPISDIWVFEAYGLIGIGSVANHLPSIINNAPLTNGDISAHILRIGVQSNLGYVSKSFSAAVSSRFVNFPYSNIEGDLVFNNDILTDYLKETTLISL